MSKRPRGEEEAAAAAPPPKKRRGRPRKAEQQGVPYRLTCVHLCQSGALFFGEGGARKCATCMEHWDDSEREWRRHPERQCTREADAARDIAEPTRTRRRKAAAPPASEPADRPTASAICMLGR
jgi:hypothetical protein